MTENLNMLVGEWNMGVPVSQGQPVAWVGRVSFEWLSEGSFLIQRWEVEYEHAPDGIALLGPDESGTKLCQHYFDSRGISRVYEMSLSGGVWKLWREWPGFSQRFAGTISDDGGTITGSWETSGDGSTWEHDFDITYMKVEGSART